MNEKTVRTIWGLTGICLIIFLGCTLFSFRNGNNGLHWKIQDNKHKIEELEIRVAKNTNAPHAHQRHMKDKAIYPQRIEKNEDGTTTIYY